MPYPYEQIFAGDPSAPERVAVNGIVTIFKPGDTAMTPLTITTLDGMPLANPIQVNESGFGPAFQHETLDQVAWAGGGFSGLFVSYKGIKDEAVAAREAAEQAAQQAAQAAADSAVEAVDEVLATKYTPLSRGQLPAGTDWNTLTSTQHAGTYGVSTTVSYINAPDLQSAGVLEVSRGAGGNLSVMHRVTAGTQMIWREAVDAGKNQWSAWSQAETQERSKSKHTEQDVRLGEVEAYKQDAPGAVRGRYGRGLPFVDNNGRLMGGIYEDGRWEILKPVGAAPTPEVQPGRYGGGVPFTDQTGRVFGGVYEDGTVEFLKLAACESSANDPEAMTVSKRSVKTTLGDSLTRGYSAGADWPLADAWPAQLGALDSSATVNNLGTSGWTIDEVAVKAGMIVPTIATDMTMPASGSVALTFSQRLGWHPSGGRSIEGSLAGVVGVLTAGPSSITFTRTNPGVEKIVTAGSAFRSASAGRKWDTLIIGLGRNDVSSSVVGGDLSVRAHVVESTRKIVNAMSAQRRRFLLWGVTTATTEGKGTANHTTITEINSDLKALYPNNFVDLRRYLVDDAIYDAGITPTSDDLAKMAADTLPPSIMADSIHFIKAIHPLIAARLFDELTKREWTA